MARTEEQAIFLQTALNCRLKKLEEAIETLAAQVIFATRQYTEVRRALEESVKLQSHYASLLNQCDGGARLVFADADAWIARLKEIGGIQ